MADQQPIPPETDSETTMRSPELAAALDALLADLPEVTS